jgi:hypothetical protein
MRAAHCSAKEPPSRASRRVGLPDHAARLMLCVVILLALFEYFEWFGLGYRKGWAVLVTAASASFVLVLLTSWFLICLALGRRFSYSLRSLFIACIAVGIICHWLTAELRAARQQREIVADLRTAGFMMRYPSTLEGEWFFDRYTTEAALPWPASLLGVDFFEDVLEVDTQGLLERFGAIKAEKLPAIGRLPRLKRLSLTFDMEIEGSCIRQEGMVHVSDEDLAFVGRLQGLEKIQISSGKNLTDASLKHLGGLSQLEDVDISCCRGISDDGFKSLARLPIAKIRLLGTGVTGSGLQHLQHPQELRFLMFFGSSRGERELGTAERFENVERFQNLETLILCDSKLNAKEVQSIGRLTKLRKLVFANVDLGQANVQYLSGLRNLQTLELHECKLTDDDLHTIKQFRDLEKLELN